MSQTKKIHGRVSPQPIDIYKKQPERKLPSDPENLALIALRRTNLRMTSENEKLAGIIIDLNNKMRGKPVKKIADIIRYWFSGYAD